MSQGIACKDAVRFPLKCNVGHGPVQNGLSEKIWRVTVNEYYEYSQRRTRIFIRRAFWSKSDRGAEAPRSGFLDCLGWRLLPAIFNFSSLHHIRSKTRQHGNSVSTACGIISNSS